MFRVVGRVWRLLATAISFTIFGLGGVLVSLLVVPFIYLTSSTLYKRHQRGKALVHHLFWLYIQMMRLLGVLTFEVHGLEKLKNAQLVLANHPTLIDVVFLIALMPNANCVVKKALIKNPFTRGIINVAGYIINDESATAVVDAAMAVFEQGDALIIFPEGTRSKPGQKLQLKRGAANVAVRTKAEVTLVKINCEPITLTKGQPWYNVPASRPHFTIMVDKVMSMQLFTDMDKPSVTARIVTNELTEYFNKEIKLSERSA